MSRALTQMIFYHESRQKVSLEKSSIYFSPYVEVEVRDEVCEKLGI